MACRQTLKLLNFEEFHMHIAMLSKLQVQFGIRMYFLCELVDPRAIRISEGLRPIQLLNQVLIIRIGVKIVTQSEMDLTACHKFLIWDLQSSSKIQYHTLSRQKKKNIVKDNQIIQRIGFVIQVQYIYNKNCHKNRVVKNMV